MKGACAAEAIWAMPLEEFDIRGRVVEVVVADEAAVGLAAGRAEFLLVEAP
jgi:hypothetical protein